MLHEKLGPRLACRRCRLPCRSRTSRRVSARACAAIEEQPLLPDMSVLDVPTGRTVLRRPQRPRCAVLCRLGTGGARCSTSARDDPCGAATVCLDRIGRPSATGEARLVRAPVTRRLRAWASRAVTAELDVALQRLRDGAVVLRSPRRPGGSRPRRRRARRPRRELRARDPGAGHERHASRRPTSRSGAFPACASACASAMEKQEACAAAISSSGLVRPFELRSARAAHVTSSGAKAPLPTLSIVPLAAHQVALPRHLRSPFCRHRSSSSSCASIVTSPLARMSAENVQPASASATASRKPALVRRRHATRARRAATRRSGAPRPRPRRARPSRGRSAVPAASAGASARPRATSRSSRHARPRAAPRGSSPRPRRRRASAPSTAARRRRRSSRP